MREEPFTVAIDGGTLHGHRSALSGDAPPALLLHGGPAFPDYMEGAAAELDGLFATIRYTQRGTPPSDAPPPYTVESHANDAVAVLDALGLQRAWVIGHSWGAFLGMHLAVLHPERLLGLIAVSPLGALPVFDEYAENQRRGLPAESIARVEEIEERRRRGEASPEEIEERMRILWPPFFVDPEHVMPPPPTIGTRASIETNASIGEHYRNETLARALPHVRLEALFVHGTEDPMPVRASLESARLIPGAEVDVIDRCGHFPWWDRPGELRRAVEAFLAA